MIPYIKDSCRGGISDEQTKGQKGSFKHAYGIDIHKRRDSISCNWEMNKIGSTNDLIRFAVNARDGSTWCFGSLGSVYSIAGSQTDPVLTGQYNDENGEIRGAAEWNENGTSNYLYWATATSIARAVFNGSELSTKTQDYKTNLDNYAYHPMKNASGSLMIGNGQFLAKIDYNGDYTNAAMNLRPGNIVKCLEERDDYTIIGSERVDNSENGHIWAWITSNTNWLYKKKIPVRGINALVDTERLLLQGGIDGEIFTSDFASTAPLNAIPAKGQCNNQVDIYNDLALFGIYGCDDREKVGIYSYGRRMQNRPFALNLEFRLSPTIAGSTVTEIGGVWVNNGIVFASWKTTDESTVEYGVDMVSSTTRATARLEGLETDFKQPHMKKHYQTEKVLMEALPAGCSVNVVYKPDRQTTGGSSSAGAGWKFADVASGGGTTYSVEGSNEAEFIINNEAKVFETGIILTPSGTSTPEITARVGYLSDNQKPF